MTEQGSISDATVLGKYVDGLEVSVSGEIREAIFADLECRKETSISNPRGASPMVDPIPGAPGGPLMLRPYGRYAYAFVMENDYLHIELTKAANLPKMLIRFRSRILYELGFEALETMVEGIASTFPKLGFKVLVRRFDLAVDFQCEGWSMPEMEDVISRARKRTVEYFVRTVTGMTFGKKGNDASLQVQIYDKEREIKVSGKGWMRGVWANNAAYREHLPVIRVEFRFFREVLRALKLDDPITGTRRGIDTIADLSSSMGDLLRHAVGDGDKRSWLRVASEGTRGKPQDRRPAAPWWRQVSGAVLEGMPETGRVKLPGGPSADFERTAKMWSAYTVKFAALAKREGIHGAHILEEFLSWAARDVLPEVLEAKGLDAFEQAVEVEDIKLGTADGASAA